ncbi:MAG: histidine kinase N-terminal 7TM domain-containing protein, partial [Bacillota bacterium]
MIFNIYALPVIISLIIQSALAYFTWQRQATPGAKPFLLLVLACSVYTLGYALEICATSLPVSFFWLKFQYLGITTLPPFLLLFVISYTGRTYRLTPLLLVAIFFIPFITLLLVYSNHHLYYQAVYWHTGGPFPLVAFSRGPWYWVQAAYMGLATIISNVLFFMMFLRTTALHRRQVAIILIGSLIPWGTHILYLAGKTPGGLDPIPFAFTFSGLLFFWGLFRYRLFDLAPLARTILFEKLPDGVLVLDRYHRLVDYNRLLLIIVGKSWTLTLLYVMIQLKFVSRRDDYVRQIELERRPH